MKMNRRAMGIGLLLTGIGGTAAYSLVDGGELQTLLGGAHPDPVSLWGFVGGEKMDFIRNPKIVELLGKKHGLTLDIRRAGSVEMVTDPGLYGQNPDFLWPSSSVMVQMARQSGIPVRRDQVVLNSPIVVYSWLPIVEALVQQGLATERAKDYFTLNLKALLQAVVAGRSWADLGVGRLYGQVMVNSTDPTKSNSGFMFAGLVANLLTGAVATPESIGGTLDAIDRLFERMGYKEHSSGKLFDSFLNEGMGGKPMVVGYESQLIEFVLNQPEAWSRIRTSPMRPVTLYPEPTVYSAHPVISLNAKADRLITALEDPEVQALAWAEHGFRGQFGGTGAADLGIPGVPEQLDRIAPMPDAAVMVSVLERLRNTA
jgi:hypothetical protein